MIEVSLVVVKQISKSLSDTLHEMDVKFKWNTKAHSFEFDAMNVRYELDSDELNFSLMTNGVHHIKVNRQNIKILHLVG